MNNNQKITVLVTGVGGGVGQGVLKSLKAIDDLNLHIIACDASNQSPGLYAADEAVILPKLGAVAYTKRLFTILREKKVDFFIPGLDMELEYGAANAEKIKTETGAEVVVSPLDVIKIADDKYLTCEFLKKRGLPHPKTFLTKQAFIASELDYPVIIKPRVGYRSIGVYKANNRQELDEIFIDDNGQVIQECIGDAHSEFTCTVACVNGKLSCVLPLKRELRSGDTYRAYPVKNEEIEVYVLSVAEALKINGSCNFQLRLDAQGVPKVFEINSRFSGTTPFCTHIGFNPVEYFIKGCLNIPYQPLIDYDCALLRYWSEMVVSTQELSKLDDNKLHSVGYMKTYGF